jgi:hypothetical protein
VYESKTFRCILRHAQQVQQDEQSLIRGIDDVVAAFDLPAHKHQNGPLQKTQLICESVGI